MIKKLITLGAMVFLLLLVPLFWSGNQALAYDTSKLEVINDYQPTLLPDSSLYFLKTWWENLQMFFTFNSVAKANLELKLANKRLVEAEKLIEKGKIDLAQRLLEKFQARIEKAIQRTEELKNQGQDVSELVAKLAANSARQQEVLAKVYNQVPTQAQEAILKAMEKSATGLSNAIENIQGLHKKQEFKKEIKGIIEKSDSVGKEKIKEKLHLE